jgi:polyisoprenoid-binding protein YceI
MIEVLTKPAVRTYQIDKAHSEAAFQVRHLVSRVRGRFSDLAGAIQFDEAHPEWSSVDVAIQAASINTAEADRDTHLRSADFFDVEKYPVLTFKSVSIARRDGDSFNVAGDLTIHGITRRVTLNATYLGKATDPWGNEKIGFDAEVALNRKDFGLNWNAALDAGGFLVGDEVKVMLSLQAA